MSQYGFGRTSGRDTDTNRGHQNNPKQISKWERDKENTEKALKELERTSERLNITKERESSVCSLEEIVRQRVLAKRELERFIEHLERLESSVTIGASSAREFAERQRVILEHRERKRAFAKIIDERRSDEVSYSNRYSKSDCVKRVSASEICEGMTPEQLLRLQTQQIKSQDASLNALSMLSSKLKATSGTIYNEIEEQMEIADDLEKDFKQTQMKMKALRKKSHELNGYRKNEIADQDRKIRLEAEKEMEKEMRAKEASKTGFWGWFQR